MKFRMKIWQFIIGLCAVIILTRVGLVVSSLELFYKFLLMLFTDFSFAAERLSFGFIDANASAILLIVIPAIIYWKRNALKIFTSGIGFTSATIIILLAFFLFAPVIAGTNPDFEKNLGVTKLLPPMSSVKFLETREANNNISREQNFLNLESNVVKKTFNDKIIFIDSMQSGGQLKYFQKGKATLIDSAALKMKNGRPVTGNKIFIFGTDELGRDIFARLVYGARISLFVGLGAVLITLILGLILGFIAGFSGGIIDSLLSRLTDMLLAFPVIFLIVLILALFGNNLLAVILVLGFSGWMSLFKIVRGEVISLKDKEYFISAKMIGLPVSSLLLKEVFPVIAASVVVNLIFQYGNVILAEAALSFLGLGTGGSYPSWGQMIEAGQSYLTSGWWMILFPGLILFFTLFAANNLGKEISLYFNPRLRR